MSYDRISATSSASSVSSSSSSVLTYLLEHECHIRYLNVTYLPSPFVPEVADTLVERPRRKQRRYTHDVTRKFTPIEVGEHQKTNGVGLPLLDNLLSEIKDSAIEQFVRACMKYPHLMDLKSLEPQRPFLNSSSFHPSPFLVALLQRHAWTDQAKSLSTCLYQPFRNQLKSLIRRAPTDLTLSFGRVTPNCTLLQYVIYSWTINNTEHVAYDWLCGLLETPNYPIDAVDCHGESALSSWSRDERIVNGLVFHKLVQAGARTDRVDSFDRSWMFHLLDLGHYNLIRSLIRHGYEHLCLDAFMQSARRSEFLDPNNSVWSERLDHEEKRYQAGEVVLQKQQAQAVAMRHIQIEDVIDDDQDIEEQRLNRVMDEGPERVMIEMRRTWMHKYQPHILDLLTSSPQNGGCGIVTDCAHLCMQYLAGTGRPWIEIGIAPPFFSMPTQESWFIVPHQ